MATIIGNLAQEILDIRDTAEDAFEFMDKVVELCEMIVENEE